MHRNCRLVLGTLLVFALPSMLHAQWTTYGYWRDPISGNWNDSGNWIWGVIPNQIGAQAELNGHLTNFRTINLGSDTWMGGLFVNDGNASNYSYTINQNGRNIYFAFSDPNALPIVDTNVVIIFNGLVAFGRGLEKRGSGSVYLSGSTSNSFDYFLTHPSVVTQGSLYLDKPVNVHAIGSTIINGGSLIALRDEQIDERGYLIFNSGYLQLHNQTLDSIYIGTGNLSFNWNGQINLTGNHAYSVGGGAQSLVVAQGIWASGINMKFSAPGGTSSGGGIAFYGNTTIANSTFDLGGQTRFWYVDDARWVTVNGTSTLNNGGLYKYGFGVLELAGSNHNTMAQDTIVDGGTLVLNKSAGVNAIGGNLHVYFGSVDAWNSQQLPDNATVTLNGGQAYLHAETVGRMLLNGGALYMTNNAPLTMTSTQQYALEAIAGLNLNGGDFRFTGASGGGMRLNHNASTTTYFNNFTLDMGGVNREIYVGSGFVGLPYVNIINGGFTKTGAGDLGISRTTNNANTATVYVQAGGLGLYGVDNTVILGGDLVVNGGYVQSVAQNLIADNATVTLNGGQTTLNNETLGRLVMNGGSLTLNNGLPLTMTSTQQYALEAIAGLNLNGGDFRFTGASGGGMRLNHNAGTTTYFNNFTLDMGGVNREIYVGSGFVGLPLVNIVNGGFTKTGAGDLGISRATNNANTATVYVQAGGLGLFGADNTVILGGDLVVNGGYVQTYGRNLIADNATVTLNGGFMYFNDETIGRFVANSGGFTISAGSLAMTSTAPYALEMPANWTINGGTYRFTGASGGGMRLLHNAAGTTNWNNAIFDFGGINREINVVQGTQNFTDVAFANGGFTKTGLGTLAILGTAASASTATTYVAAGELRLQKSANVNAIGGDLVVNGGAVTTVSDNQIANNATVTLNGGSIAFRNETIGKFVANAGGFTLAGGPLNLTSTQQHALEMTTGSNLTGGTFQFTGASGGGMRLNHNASGNSTWNGIVVNLGGTAREIFVGNGVANFNNVSIQNGGIRKTGAGTLLLNGSTSYAGGTQIEAGTLTVTNATGSATGTGSVSVLRNATLAGNGAIGGVVRVAAGGTVSPGVGVGKLTVGAMAWSGSGNYNWQLKDATGSAGIGYDTLQIQGPMDLTSSHGVLLNLATVQSDGQTPGLAANFDSDVGRSWLLATATGRIVGWDPNDFRIVASANNGMGGFLNDLDGGSFRVRATLQQLWLDFIPTGGGIWTPSSFAPIPEPSHLLGLAVAALAAGALRRRLRLRSVLRPNMAHSTDHRPS